MLTSFSLTIPSIADNFRTMGRQLINTPMGISHQQLLIGPSDSDNIHHYWHKQAVKNVYDGLNSNKSSNRNYLSDRPKPIRGTNATNPPFGLSNSPYNVITGRGGANITTSSSATDKEKDDYRKFIINQRGEGYVAIRNSEPMPQQIPPNIKTIMTNPNKAIQNQLSLLLTSIEERVFSGITDNNVYKDLNEFIKGIEGVIYTYDDAQQITDLIKRLEDISNSAEVIAARRGTQQKQKESNFAESVITSIDRLIDFLKANISTVGRNESTRLFNQQVSSEYLTKIGERRPDIATTGKLTEPEVAYRIKEKIWTKESLKNMTPEELLGVANNLDIRLRKNVSAYPDLKNLLIKSIKSKLTSGGYKIFDS
jgi:hypothetical protein